MPSPDTTLGGRVSSYIRQNVLALVAIYLALSGAAIAAIPDDNSVLSRHIVDGEVKTADIGSSAVNSSKLGTNAIPADGFTVGDGSTKIASGAVSTNEVRDNTLTAADLDVKAVGSPELGVDAIAADGITVDDGSSKIALNAIGSSELKADAVGNAEIAGNAVGIGEITANSVATSEVADNSLFSSDIASDSIGSSELAPDAVGSASVVNNSLTGSDVAETSLSQSVLQRRVTSTCTIAQGITTIDSSGGVDCSPGPAGYYGSKDTLGIICNDFCVEGSLNLPPGSYAIFAKVTLFQPGTQEANLSASCKLEAGADMDFAFVHIPVDSLSNKASVITLQLMHSFGTFSGAATVSCEDSDTGDAGGSNLTITAIRLGSLSKLAL